MESLKTSTHLMMGNSAVIFGTTRSVWRLQSFRPAHCWTKDQITVAYTVFETVKRRQMVV
eukprot:11214170-Ditylum_brightwellii.AAC.1